MLSPYCIFGKLLLIVIPSSCKSGQQDGTISMRQLLYRQFIAEVYGMLIFQEQEYFYISSHKPYAT